MKVILIVLIAGAIASSARATEPSATPIEPDDTAEVLSIAGSTLFTTGNVITIIGKTPSYWLGGLSIGMGVTTMLFAAADHPPHETGLWVSGTFAIATGFTALIYRHALNQPENHARLEPAWTHGSPGLALVVDF